MGISKEARNCDECDMEFNSEESIKNGTFFLHIPLKNQLIQLLTHPILFQFLTNRDLDILAESNDVCDITTGKLYKKLIRSHAMSKNDISVTWNADGVPIFKSSQYSLWPVQCMINELPPHLRSHHILLTDLWFGRSKPKMNTFLEAFVSECKDFETSGFYFQEESNPRKVFALICSSDSPARAMLRNCKQYNGKYGCDWCEHEGVTIIANRGPPTRYYPQRGAVPMRTSKSQAQYAVMAEHANEPVKGVKGLSVIDLLPTFNTVNGFTSEYMHSVCQGVVRELSDLWFDSSHHDQPFYLGRKADKVDERLTRYVLPLRSQEPLDQ